jgi:two-component system CheB/CheR fusion protein
MAGPKFPAGPLLNTSRAGKGQTDIGANATMKSKVHKSSSASKVSPLTKGLTPQARAFPVVAIGASAGGLEAYKEFFHAMPADTGMAFVLIQHLDPSHHSLLAEILSKTTRMPVEEVRQGPG